MSLVAYRAGAGALGAWNALHPIKKAEILGSAARGIANMAWNRYRRRPRRIRVMRRRRGPTVGQKRKQLGFPQGVSNAKRRNNLDDAEPTSLDTRTLYSEKLCQIPRTTTNDISQRQRDMIKISGIKLCLSFKNSSSTTTNALNINVAVITPRGTLSNPSNTDFFRASNANSRSRDFTSTLSSVDYQCLPINADDYIVHWHKRFKCKTANSNEGDGVRQIMKYIKINRQFRYDSEGADPTTPTPYLVWWACRVHEGETAGVAINGYTLLKRATMYFREVGS